MSFSCCVVHPGCHALVGALQEGTTEGPVAAEATLVSQLLGTDRLSGSNARLVAPDEMVDAKVVDVSIIGNALTGEILAEVVAVGVDSLGQLFTGDVVLQVELRGFAAFAQQLANLFDVDV